MVEFSGDRYISFINGCNPSDQFKKFSSRIQYPTHTELFVTNLSEDNDLPPHYLYKTGSILKYEMNFNL